MSARWHAWAHRPLRILGWCVGIAVIALALSAALIQVLLPLLAQRPQWVAAELSERLHRPISFSSLQGRWEPSGPRFVMQSVTVAPGPDEGGKPLHIPEAELKLDFGGWLFPSRHFLNLEARGLELDLGRDADGSWHINGLGVTGGADRQNVSFGNLSLDLWLDDLRIDISDVRLGEHYSLQADQLRLSRQDDHIHIGARLHRIGAAGVLVGAGRFRDDGSSGRFWLSASNADLHGMLAGVDLGGYVINSGRGDIAAWMDWKDSKVVRDLIQFKLTDLAITNPTQTRVGVPSVAGLAELLRTDSGYDVRWAGDDGGALIASLKQPGTPQAQLNLAADNLQLAAMVPWLALKPNMAPALTQWLAAGHPRGQLHHVHAHWNGSAGLQELDGSFDSLGIDPVGKLPGVDHLQGELRGDSGAASVELPAQTLTLAMPHTFRQPLLLSKFGGNIALWHDDDAWHLGIADLDFTGEGYGGDAQGEIAFPDAGGRPFLDIYASISHADINAAKLFWPIDAMAPPAIAWLDQALVSGSVDNGAVLVRGDLADWPFKHNEGRFEANVDINNLNLQYGKDWPQAQGVQAVASFVGTGMTVQVSAAQSLGVKVDKASATIPDLGNATLDLLASGNGNAADMLSFVGKSPIANKQADVLAKMKLGGTGTFDFHLVLPVKDMHDMVLTGNAQLKAVDLDAPEWNLKLDNLTGPATFDSHGFHGGPLSGGFRGEPSKLDLAIAGATNDPATVVKATLSGNYTVAELIQGYSQLKWLGDVASGRADFEVGYQLGHTDGTAPAAQSLTIDSPMSGMALNFPVPLKKSADSSLPLHVAMSVPMAGSDLRIALGSVMRGRLRLPANDKVPLAATFAFGDQMPDSVPAKGMRITGHATQLDVTGWVKQSIGGGSSGNGLSLDSVDVSTEHAQLFGRDFNAMHMTATPHADALEMDVTSDNTAGHFSVPTTSLSKRGITARLQRLYWPKEPTAPPPKPGAAPVSLGDPGNTGIDPASVPPLHIWIADLRMGDSKLGEARLETWPVSNGMHVDQLSTQSKSVQITAGGDWLGTPTKSATHMRVDFAADNLGNMLNAFGFEGLFDGGKTRDQLNASWPGGPWAFELANMDGTLSVNVTNGRIPDVAPGVGGRFFGLASVAEFPRRLSLDFGDVFGKGLGFDLIAGDFQLADGNATTQNLHLHGPAAEIAITGRTGLRARDYDQQMTVTPHIGNSLPVVGAVVGGPVGAAAGLAVQGILGKGLNHVLIKHYRITGSWDKPVIAAGAASKADLLPAAASSAAPVPAPASSSAQ